jgi:NAD(P)-dependent dehydrogenase (short-subunit alcohol dehydrogenase family)
MKPNARNASKLEGKIALIPSGNRGIGMATAETVCQRRCVRLHHGSLGVREMVLQVAFTMKWAT